jgi:RimJ/RimL family protein N-acetyltransferase
MAAVKGCEAAAREPLTAAGRDGQSAHRDADEPPAGTPGWVGSARNFRAGRRGAGQTVPVTQDLSPVAWPARTDRLTIRPATPDDLDATWAFRRLAEVSEWVTWTGHDRDRYAEQFLDAGRLSTTLVVEHDGVVVGDLMLRIGDAWAQGEVADRAAGVQAELGWTLDPAYAGRGYATEAVTELLRICFEDLALRRVVALCFADNTASWRLMERVGLRREQHAVRDSLHRSGQWLDGYGYALLAEEWHRRAVGR